MITLKFTVEQANALINALNLPMDAGSVTLANLIKLIVDQAQEQIPNKEETKDGE